MTETVSETKTKPKNKETVAYPPIRPREGADVLSSFIGRKATSEEEGARLELVVTCFDFSTLNDSKNFAKLEAFCAARGGTVQDVINETWGKAWATKPTYPTEGTLEERQAQGQKALDEYTVGQRATSTTQKVDKTELAKLKAAQVELAQMESIREALGMDKDQFTAYLQKLAAKKAGK